MNAVLPQFMSPCTVFYKAEKLPGLYALTDEYGSANDKFILVPAVFMTDALPGDLFTVFLEKQEADPSMIVPARQVNSIYCRAVAKLLGPSPQTSLVLKMTKGLFWQVIENFEGNLLHLRCETVFSGEWLEGDITKSLKDIQSFFTINGVRLELVDKLEDLSGNKAVFGNFALRGDFMIYDRNSSPDLTEKIEALEGEIKELKLKLDQLREADSNEHHDQ